MKQVMDTISVQDTGDVKEARISNDCTANLQFDRMVVSVLDKHA